FDCVHAPGAVTVIIVPDMPGPRPTPSSGLRRAVAAFLQRRRLLGTRVAVVGPRYVEVGVRARVRPLRGVARVDVRDRIVAALDEFLHPLRGGPDGAGWPFGRDVYRAEIMQVIDEVAGVDHVESLDLVPEGCGPQCGNVCLRPTWLTTPGRHEIEVV
ncbi:MAG TPA: baseplate J/gp47 family protein, partial [Candidatus Binatia bacterium]|nr:baseplate J/gp47 family protein [Candidatus Binatia bacterium]